MAKRAPSPKAVQRAAPAPGWPSSLVDTRIIYCGDCLDQLSCEPRPSASGLLPKLPDGCVDRPYVWHRLPTGEPGSNRNYEVFWGALSEPRPSGSGVHAAFEDRHAGTQAYIDYMRPRVAGDVHAAVD